MEPSILLIAPEPPAGAIAQRLRRDLDATVEIAPHGHGSVLELRGEEYTLILLDENLALAEPDATEALYSTAGSAPIVEINFAICGLDRVVRQVRSTLRRRAMDEAKARTAAVVTLHNQLNASLAGLLLESQLALRQAGPDLAPTLRHVIELASGLREHLRT